MKLLKTIPHLTDEELLQMRNKQKESRQYINWQIIYSVQTNKCERADKIANILGVSRSKLQRIIQSYNKLGVHWQQNKKW
ncbi:MAG: hypothetical protein LBV69_11690 [Bacteroidales bacterium]|jgi:transposase|nr:hypothetical protein [Bacteroidales bacterium]